MFERVVRMGNKHHHPRDLILQRIHRDMKVIRSQGREGRSKNREGGGVC